MVGRKTKFTTQNKATQGRRRVETEEGGKKKLFKTQENYTRGKEMEKKQILKKSKMKVNQAEEKLIFHFFYSSTTVYSH